MESTPLLGQSISIQLDGLTVSVPQAQKKSIFTNNKQVERRIVLNDVTGQFVQGRLTAIMGGSGAGKTTLLNAIVNIL
jgi:ABC-type multidrug transport system ATPase subunit